MTIPTVHDFPVKRPGFITACDWIGTDNTLQLKIDFVDATGAPKYIKFNTRNVGDSVKGEVCLPVSLLGNDLHNLGDRYEDVLLAHTRMACMVSRSGIPGSDEFNDALTNGETANLNTGLGIVKVTDVAPVDDQTVMLTYKCGTGPNLDIPVGYADLNNYQFEPETQLFVVPGAIKKQFSTYVHNYPSTILTQTQRDNIVEYVLTLTPWI